MPILDSDLARASGSMDFVDPACLIRSMSSGSSLLGSIELHGVSGWC